MGGVANHDDSTLGIRFERLPNVQWPLTNYAFASELNTSVWCAQTSQTVLRYLQIERIAGGKSPTTLSYKVSVESAPLPAILAVSVISRGYVSSITYENQFEEYRLRGTESQCFVGYHY